MSEVYLPEGVIFNVLARLHVKTLLKLRCVSKSWADLIDSREFIKSHVNLSLTDPKSQRFVFENPVLRSRTNLRFWPGILSPPQDSQNFVPPNKLYCPEPIYSQGTKLVGSSRGLVCIRFVKDGVYLCNPWTRKYRKLPRSPLEIFPEGRNWIYTNYGFGYDDIHDDYKVVRLVGVRTKTSQRFCNEVKVYSLRSNKWKTIENLPDSMPKGASGVLLNHTLHWILNGQKSILAIDLRTEERQFLLLPENIKRQQTRHHPILGVSDGTLCVSLGDDVGLEIWLMKDYRIKDSWTKLEILIPTLNCTTASLVRYSEFEKQLILYNKFTLCWCDIETKVLKKCETVPVGNFFYTVESLVPLCSADQRGRRSKCRKITNE